MARTMKHLLSRKVGLEVELAQVQAEIDALNYGPATRPRVAAKRTPVPKKTTEAKPADEGE